MANVTIGRYRNQAGPALATVAAGEQLASFTVGHVNQVITLTSMGAWMGRSSSSPIVRLALFWEHPDGRPGGVAGYTEEIVLDTDYTGGSSGKMYTAPLTTPLVVPAGHKLRVGVTSRNGTAAIAMIGKGDIAEADENLYRKNVSGNIPQDAVGSVVQNEGQLMIYATGTDTGTVINTPPYPPDQLAPTGVVPGGDLTPLLSMRHTDPNGDGAKQANMQVRRKVGGALVMNATWDVSVASGKTITRVYDGSGLEFYTDYEFRGRTHDGKDWGAYSDWVTFQLYHDNKPPAIPLVQAPFPENWQRPGDVTGFTWVFADEDALLPGMITWERTSSVQILIRNRATGADVWDSGPVSTVRYHGEQVTLTYSGPALQYVTNYDVYYIHRDRRGAANSVKRTMYFPLGSSVDEPSTPKGRVTNLANPGTINAVYRHSQGVAANAFQVRLVNEQGTQIAYTTVMPRTIANGTTISNSWTGLTWVTGSGTLPAGTRLGVEVRARDSVTNVMSEWSPTSWLDANAAPGVPILYSPDNGAAFNTNPKLVALVTDPDQSPTQLTVPFEIATDQAFENVIATINGTRTAGGTNIGARGRFEIDTAALALVLGTEYYWRAYSYDGFLYSGNTTAAASASRSTARAFTYADVPGVTITSPATVATPSPTITWTSTQAQVKYQVLLTDSDGLTVYDSGEVTSSIGEHQVTADGWLDGNEWENGEILNGVVRVLSALWGTSAPQATTLTYAYPDTPTSVAVMAITPQGHVGTTAIQVSHDATGYSESEFAWYRYYRTEISGPGGADIPDTRTLLLTNTNSAATWFEDWNLMSGAWYRYDVTQGIYSGVDVIESLAMSGEAMAQWHGVVLHLPYQPQLYNVHLRFGPPKSSHGTSSRVGSPRNSISGIGVQRRIVGFGRKRELDVSGEFALHNDRATGLSGLDLVNRLDRLMKCASGYDSPDKRAHIVCWRDGDGNRNSVVEGTFTESTTITKERSLRDVWIASLSLEDAEFVLGEEVPA